MSPEQLFSTNGNSQALEMLCTVLTKPGDVVIVEEPTYFLAFQMFRDHGLEIRGVPIDSDGLVVDALSDVVEAVRAAGKRVAFVYTIPAFQNPTGVTMSLQRREELVKAATAADVLIVADEVYHLLRFAAGAMPPSMSAYRRRRPDPVDRHVLQDPRPGYATRVDPWCRRSPRLARRQRVDPQRRWAQPRHVEPVDGDDADGMAAGVPRVVACDVCPTLGNHDLSAARAHARVGEYDVPSGGYFVWLRLPPGTDGSALRSIAKQHRVDLRHGAQFSPTGALGNHLRLSYAFYDDDDVAEGVARLGQAFQSPDAGAAMRGESV